MVEHQFSKLKAVSSNLISRSMFGEIIYTKEDEAYFIKRVIPENQFDKPDMKVLKKLFHCDTVLRNKGQYYFCQHVKSVEFEEINGEKSDNIK